ncbi:MAG: lipid-A-disaccharide synthase [Planctomycetes bacterium]|nr:lipid-A-disaccharide synthase [Planctomycetota bacterium]
MAVFIVAGEDSGDLHAANLIRQLKQLRPEARLEGFGGDRMAQAGCFLHANITHMSSMGVSFLAHVYSFLGLIFKFYRILQRQPPDVLVLIDFPGFNFILARLARFKRVPVVYYICPQIWAWAPWRRRKILRLTQLLLVILPFEETLYRQPLGRQTPPPRKVIYVGHPLGDALAEQPAAEKLAAELRQSFHLGEEVRVIGIFPGSRRHEIEGILPIFRKTVEKLALDPERHRLVVSCCRRDFRPLIERAFQGFPTAVEIVEGSAYPLMAACRLALVASGTATLELAFFQKPMVVLYKVGRLAHRVFRWISTSPFICLVNILGGREIVPESITSRDNSSEQAERVRALLEDTPERRQCLAELSRLKTEIFRPGASLKAAKTLLGFLEGRG